MKTENKLGIISVIVFLIGILLGSYIGIWLLLISGIMGIAHAIDNNTVTATIIAVNIIKIVLSPVGILISQLFTGFAIGLVKEE